jgi:hypothetical protein
VNEELLGLIRRDRFAAHTVLFRHRHEYPFATFHRDLVEDFWAPEWAVIDLGFRECGKTTLVEEGITIAALEGGFRNCLIIGAKEELAAELLTNIKSELENNELIGEIWGPVRGDTWTNTKITFRDGRCIQARGVGQTMRGTQHRNMRPDLVVVNDFEDDEEVLTPEGRRKTMRWFLKILLPACDRARRRVRIYDTVRDADSVPMMLIKQQRWKHRFVPICYTDEAGEERSSWPGHPTLTEKWIATERRMYASMGAMDIFEREYMCSATSQADRVFTAEMVKPQAVEHTFQGKWAMIDPARSVRRSAAFTGWAVWSWEKHRLIVWEAGAKHMLPDEIVDLAFRLNREHAPVEIGVEEDGLNEWLLQPIRMRVAREGAVPYKAFRAPRSKLDFIRGLQPFFSSGMVALAGEMPELRDQLLSFPTGRIDALNALAYALLLRPGRLVYEGFNPNVHIRPLEAGVGGSPLYLAANALRSMVVAVLVQVVSGRIECLADWVVEGDPGEATESVVRSASMFAGRGLTAIAGPRHFDQWQNVGLIQSFREMGVRVQPGAAPDAGRAVLRRGFESTRGGEPEFIASPDAVWTLRALAGGYATPFRDGRLADGPEDNRYRVLMEGLESLAGLFQWGMDEEKDRNYAFDQITGRRYLSILPQERLPNAPEKRYG